jgi:DNA invertase Pin-like site-specific DNA recombinase
MTKQLRAGVYARLSRDPDGDAGSVDRQLGDARERAEREGWTIVAEYVDRDRSASKRGVVREQWERMLADLRRGRLDVIIAWRADRLARRPIAMATLRDVLDETGKRLVTISDGLDTATSAGRFTLGILGEVAAAEATAISERTRSAKRASLAAGKPKHGGRRGFGHDRSGRVVQDEAEAIRAAVAAVLRGEAMLSIARSWNEAEIRTPTGGAWSAPHLRRMLRQPRLVGAREGTDGEWIVTGEIEPIVSEADLRRLRTLVDDPKRITTSPRKHPNLLTGVAYCGVCGARLTTSTVRDRQMYQCRSRPELPGCGKVSVSVALADSYVAGQVMSVLAGEAFVAALAELPEEEDTSATARALAADRARLEDLHRERFLGGRAISTATYSSIRAELESRISSAEQALSDAAGAPLLASINPEALEATWESESVDWRRAVVRTLVERIDVDPARRPFNVWRPERLRIKARYAGATSSSSASMVA